MNNTKPESKFQSAFQRQNPTDQTSDPQANEQTYDPSKSPIPPASYSCNGCGGTMVYSPDTKSLKCQFCESTQEIEDETGEIKENDYDY